jgi:nucleotide-binding universal stress UspA family protein
MQERVIAIPGRQNDEQRVRHPIVLKRILAPTDLTPDGKKAVEYAVALAEHFDARLTLLHVYRAAGANDYERILNDYSVADQLQENAQNALDSF